MASVAASAEGYTQAVTEVKRTAQSRVVRQIMGPREAEEDEE